MKHSAPYGQLHSCCVRSEPQRLPLSRKTVPSHPTPYRLTSLFVMLDIASRLVGPRLVGRHTVNTAALANARMRRLLGAGARGSLGGPPCRATSSHYMRIWKRGSRPWRDFCNASRRWIFMNWTPSRDASCNKLAWNAAINSAFLADLLFSFRRSVQSETSLAMDCCD